MTAPDAPPHAVPQVEARPADGGDEALAAALNPRTETMLRERALAAMGRAYAPYSRFQVGAALLASDGSITEGCNIENSSFPATICAERTAVASAVARGTRSFAAIVIATDADEPTPPCGVCRQVLVEFAPQLQIISITRQGAEARWTLGQLLPNAFNPQSLGIVRE